MKKIEAHCNSPEMAIRSQVSTDFLWHILKGMWSQDANKIVKIFNKVKSISAVTEEEYNFILSFLKQDDFKCTFYEKLSLLEIHPKKKDNFTFEALYSSFYTSLIIARTIGILQNCEENTDIYQEWKVFRKVLQNDHKTLFLNITDEFEEYYISFDLRSTKNKLFSKKSNHCIVETYAEIEFAWFLDRSRDVFLLESDGKSQYIVFWEKTLVVSKNVVFYEWKFSFYVIDPVDSLVYQIDKESLKLTTRDFQNSNFINIKWCFILTFILPTILKNEEWSDYSSWALSLLDIQNWKNIFSDIHLRYHDLNEKYFVWISADIQYYYVFDFTSNNKKAILITDIVPEEILNRWDEAVYNFLKDINQF